MSIIERKPTVDNRPRTTHYVWVHGKPNRKPFVEQRRFWFGYKNGGLLLKAGVTNIFDKLYQPFKSDPAPGRALVFTTELSF